MNAPLPAAGAPELGAFVDRMWDDEIVPAVSRYIEIPAKSPMFDPDWQAHGHIEHVVREAAAWIERCRIPGLTLEIVRLEGRTPLLFFDVPATGAATANQTVCLYGHLDKQPEFSGWRNGLGPWTPRLVDGLLYGRGGADDGYAVHAAIAAIMALDREGIPRPRCVGIVETCEESGSVDLPAQLDALRGRLGDVGLVVCLDSGAGNYDQLWVTTSLRGMVTGTLRVDILTEGVHSGPASGIVPSSFRILRHLLDRLEDSRTGELLPQVFHCEIPADRAREAAATAAILGESVWKRQPWACGAEGRPAVPTTTDPLQAVLNRTWRPALAVTGGEGFPSLRDAGNVLRPSTAFKLSLRLPPLVDGNAAAAALKLLLEDNAPYDARVVFTPDARAGTDRGTTGWSAPDMAPWFSQSLDAASRTHFGQPCGYIGEGGTIPLMSLLQAAFPAAQMLVCGVLGPRSNAHGPNEFLHVAFAKRLTAAVAQVIGDFRRPRPSPQP
jgi:acetylornithine deacetylase/succinyl-diaminopimelate desuccinylase-like protein